LQALGAEKGFRVIRVMPNTPSSIGQGASAFARGATVTDADAMLVSRLFEAVGVVAQVTESQLDGTKTMCTHVRDLESDVIRAAVTGLSGSGPAYVLMMIEALADGGVAAGLPRVVAHMLATQLVGATTNYCVIPTLLLVMRVTTAGQGNCHDGARNKNASSSSERRCCQSRRHDNCRHARIGVRRLSWDRDERGSSSYKALY
jgi:hypothetical protein